MSLLIVEQKEDIKSIGKMIAKDMAMSELLLLQWP